MSTQSIFHKSSEDLLSDLDSYYMKLGVKYMNNKRFSIGNSPDISKVKILNRLRRIICEDNCNQPETIKIAKKTLNSLLINA